MEDFVGEFKKKREELGLTLSEVSEKTNVHKKYLKAIEEGNFEEVQGEVFLKGFIKIYSNTLGLNTEEILFKYEEYRNDVLDEDASVEDKTLNEKLGKYFADSQDGFLLKAVIIVILVLILGFAAFYVYMNLLSDNSLPEEENTVAVEEDNGVEAEENDVEETEENDVEEIEEDTTEEGDTPIDSDDESAQMSEVDLEELADTEVESEEVTANEDGEIEIEVVTLEETWYSVTVDQEIVFEDFTEEGDENTFQGAYIELVIGNAAGVEIIKEDEVFGPFGESGDVVHQEYIVE